jgi:glyoxylase-like metal-dependent hydrolase (beta-lactamase superfamily II)
MKPLFTLTLLLCTIAAGAQNFDTVKIRALKLTDQIYMLKGSGGNIGLMTGPEGLVMIDDQFAPLSKKIRDAVRAINQDSIRFLINTHLHGDHTGGNENFKRMGVTIAAHDNVRDRMSKEQFNARANRSFPPRDKDAWPVLTFPGQMTIHLNGDDIMMSHFSNGHTDGDIIIQFKSANIFHTGDSFVRTSYPFIDASSGGAINGYITNLDKILEMTNDQSRIIPGHGDLATKKDVQGVRDMVVDIRDQVSKALKSGKKLEDIPAMNITARYDEKWGQGFMKGKDFVIAVAQSLEAERMKK